MAYSRDFWHTSDNYVVDNQQRECVNVRESKSDREDKEGRGREAKLEKIDLRRISANE